MPESYPPEREPDDASTASDISDISDLSDDDEIFGGRSGLSTETLPRSEEEHERVLKFFYSTRRIRDLWQAQQHLDSEDLASVLYNVAAVKWILRSRRKARYTFDDLRNELGAKRRDSQWKLKQPHVVAWPAEADTVPKAGERHVNRRDELGLGRDGHTRIHDDESSEWLKDELLTSSMGIIRRQLNMINVSQNTSSTRPSGRDQLSQVYELPLILEVDEDDTCEKLDDSVEHCLRKTRILLRGLRHLRAGQFGQLNSASYRTALEEDLSREFSGSSACANQDVGSVDQTVDREPRRSRASKTASAKGIFKARQQESIRDRLRENGLPVTLEYEVLDDLQSCVFNAAEPSAKRRKSMSKVTLDVAKAARNDEVRRTVLDKLDWRHVLGMAASSGIDSKVIARAKERCESLFHHRMSFELPYHAGRTLQQVNLGNHQWARTNNDLS